jgi:hypothetical protein
MRKTGTTIQRSIERGIKREWNERLYAAKVNLRGKDLGYSANGPNTYPDPVHCWHQNSQIAAFRWKSLILKQGMTERSDGARLTNVY